MLEKIDVMEYFGEWISEDECETVIECALRRRRCGGFTDQMNAVREYLKEVLGHDVRFMSGYRRVKT